MCGIVGIISKSKQEDKLETMLKDLSHRGPDDSSYKIYKINDYFVHLGSTRLSIMGDEKDNMPMENEKGNSIIYNGEMFNLKQMNAKLDKSKNYSNDTRLLLEFLSSPNNALDALNGMFAFAYLDNSNKSLTIARDKLGIKPLFYSINPDEKTDLIFCSETIPIINSFEKFKLLSKIEIQNSLLLGGIHSDNKTIEGIDICKPGYFINWSPKNKIEVKKFSRAAKEFDYEVFNEETFTSLMCTVLEDHLTASTNVDLFLSGGLDSSYLALLAKRELGKEIRHFSLVYENESFSEGSNINYVSNQLSLNKTIFEVKNNEIDEIVNDSLKNMKNLILDQSYVPTYYLSKQASFHTKAVISGDGADELFGGYEWYRASKYHNLFPPATLKLLKGINSRLNIFYIKDRYLNLINKLNYFFKDINSNIYVQNLIWQSFLINISNNNYSELEEKVFEIINHFDNYQNNLRTIDMNYYLQSQILPKVDSASMANSLEVRPPYLDERIIDFALGIDNASNFNFKKTKINLFKVLEKSEIKDITKQKKHGFAFPLEAWVLKNFNTIKDSDILYELNIGTNELTNSKYNSNSMRLMWSLIVIHNWIESNNLSFR